MLYSSYKYPKFQTLARENPDRFEPLVEKANKNPNPPGTNKPTSINGLIFASINFNSIRGKKI